MTTLWRDIYRKIDYEITEKGKHALELYTSKVKHFVFSLIKTYHDGQKDDLYNLVMENKDFLWFGYYEGLITKSQIENIAKGVDTNAARLWYDGLEEAGGVVP